MGSSQIRQYPESCQYGGINTSTKGLDMYLSIFIAGDLSDAILGSLPAHYWWDGEHGSSFFVVLHLISCCSHIWAAMFSRAFIGDSFWRTILIQHVNIFNLLAICFNLCARFAWEKDFYCQRLPNMNPQMDDFCGNYLQWTFRLSVGPCLKIKHSCSWMLYKALISGQEQYSANELTP